MSRDITLCVLFYNKKDLVERCLANICENILTSGDVDVLALDNGSQTDIYSVMRSFPGVKAFRVEDNRFFSGGANYLFERCSSKHVFFVTSDVFPERSTIMRMVDFAESNPDVGLIGCSSILPTGVTERTAKKEMSPWVMHFQYGAGSQIARWCQGAFSRWYHYGSKGFPFSKPTEVDVIQDSFIYIKGELLQKGLRFDECMKLYFTEDDLCLNVKSRGYKVVFYPEVSVRHILQATLDQRDLKVWDMYLDDCVAYLCKYHGVHGKVLEACVRGKRTLKKVLGYVK